MYLQSFSRGTSRKTKTKEKADNSDMHVKNQFLKDDYHDSDRLNRIIPFQFDGISDSYFVEY